MPYNPISSSGDISLAIFTLSINGSCSAWWWYSILKSPRLGVKNATIDSILRKVENTPQKSKQSLDEISKNIFSTTMALICKVMQVFKLRPVEIARAYFGLIWIPKIVSWLKIVSSPAVVAVSVNASNKTRICSETWIKTSVPAI